MNCSFDVLNGSGFLDLSEKFSRDVLLLSEDEERIVVVVVVVVVVVAVVVCCEGLVVSFCFVSFGSGSKESVLFSSEC
jgi:hypothetical protein